MAESLREMIERRRQQLSQAQAKPQPKKTETPKQEEMNDEYLDEDESVEEVEEEKPKPQPKSPEKQETSEDADQIGIQVELLQNDGRFRLELLGQLQEINKALVVIAGALVDLTGKDGQTKTN